MTCSSRARAGWSASLDGREQRRAATASAGVLMSKTIQLSGDVYLAMRSRGFQGEVYVLDEFRTGWFDWAMLAVFHGSRCWLSGWDDESLDSRVTKRWRGGSL